MNFQFTLFSWHTYPNGRYIVNIARVVRDYKGRREPNINTVATLMQHLASLGFTLSDFFQ